MSVSIHVTTVVQRKPSAKTLLATTPAHAYPDTNRKKAASRKERISNARVGWLSHHCNKLPLGLIKLSKHRALYKVTDSNWTIPSIDLWFQYDWITTRNRPRERSCYALWYHTSFSIDLSWLQRPVEKINQYLWKPKQSREPGLWSQEPRNSISWMMICIWNKSCFIHELRKRNQVKDDLTVVYAIFAIA